MKRRKILSMGVLLSAFVFACLPMTVFASDTGNAVRDILVDDRFNGAMSSIKWLTEMVDNWFIKIITVTAFFIISMSLLKNVMAAAYCAFPVFFNKVHEAHQQMKWSEQSLGGFKEVGSKLKDGKISDVILSIIPDFKALTDFADQEMSPKTYFMKAIPQMCIMVIIGIFIYNGYYRDVSATVGEAGATMVENLLSSVSPETAVNNLFNMTGEPDNTYKNDKTLQGTFIKELSNAMYKEIKNHSTVYKETKENKENLLRCCEKAAYDMVTGNSTYNGLVGWAGESSLFKGTDQYDLSLSAPDADLTATTTKSFYEDRSGGYRFFRYELPISMIINGPLADSETGLQGKTLVVTGTLTPVAPTGETFETAIEAIQGNMSHAAGAGFSSVTVNTIPANAAKANGKAKFNINDMKPTIEQAIVASLANNGTYVTDSLVFNGTNAGGYVTVTEGTRSELCTVTFSYKEFEQGADGQQLEGVDRQASVSVIYDPGTN